MSHIAIMTDSNCGFSTEDGKRLGIHILPMPVIINGHTYSENVDLTPNEFFQMQQAGCDITTSQPSPGDVISMWRQLLQTYDEIVFLPMSSGLSNTCQTATILAQEEEFAGKVFVTDNRRISVTQAQGVLDACTLVQAGYSAHEIKEILEKEALDATIYIAVDTLQYLKKGGRITPAAAAIGTVLNLKPVLTIQGDKLDSFSKARGMRAAFRIMLDALQHDIDTRFPPESGIPYKIGMADAGMVPDAVAQYQSLLQDRFPGADFFYLPLTMSIATHTGPGALGIGAVRCRKGTSEAP